MQALATAVSTVLPIFSSSNTVVSPPLSPHKRISVAADSVALASSSSAKQAKPSTDTMEQATSGNADAPSKADAPWESLPAATASGNGAEGSTAPADSKDAPPASAKSIYLATYSNVSVYELMVRGIACMRRRSDGYINATQILKIAGIDKARRTKILEKEILTGKHEKVQGGYGKYQGTWIPLNRAQELSATYNVAHMLSPLLEFDPAKAGTIPVAGPRKKANPNAPAQSVFYREGPGAAQLAAAKGAAVKGPGKVLSSASPAPPQSSAPASGPSLEPRFISLRPPPGVSSIDSDGSATASINSLIGASFFPRGSTADQREALVGYSSHGYTPQGVPLPNALATGKSGASAESSGLTSNGNGNKRAADSAFEEPSEDRDTKRSRGGNDDAATVVESGLLALGPSPVKDLNALGRSASPTSALRGARAPKRLHRVVLGPPDSFRQLQLDGTRFADRPQTLHEGDEGERKMRQVLLQLFVEDKLANADGEDQTEVITAQDEKKLDDLLAELKQAATQSAATTEGEEGVANGASHAGTNGVGSQLSQIDMSAPPPCVDLVIDEHGHTALHWSTALAKVSHVRMLVARAPSSGGANTHAGNHGGETALHRTVLVSNAYDTSAFPALLHLLAPSLHTRDYRKRTVLHHIALISSVRGRGVAARYYLACVLEYIARFQGGRYASLVDAQDDEGETALNIVARVGNVGMVKMLLDVGARKDITNNLGLKASDWGIEGVEQTDDSAPGNALSTTNASDAQQPSAQGSKQSDAVSALQRPPRAPVQKSKDVLEQMTTVLSDLTDVFQKELTDKEDAFNVAQAHLQSATRELAIRRRRIAESQTLVAERDEARMRRRNLAKALKEELGVDQEEENEDDALIAQLLMVNGDESVSDEKMDLDQSVTADPASASTAGRAFASDAPFRQSDDDELVKLRWLEEWYEKNVDGLQKRIEALHEAGQAKMEQCRKVVAMCCGTPEDKVEGMLDELVLAIESIGSEGVDLQRLAGFLSKVKEPKQVA